jgi:hypothetical protein
MFALHRIRVFDSRRLRQGRSTQKGYQLGDWFGMVKPVMDDAPFNDHTSYFDFYVFVTHYAPDFPAEDFLEEGEQLDLERAFELLRYGIQFIRPALSDDKRRSAEAVLDEAHAAFAEGDSARGLRILHGYEQELFDQTG